MKNKQKRRETVIKVMNCQTTYNPTKTHQEAGGRVGGVDDRGGLRVRFFLPTLYWSSFLHRTYLVRFNWLTWFAVSCHLLSIASARGCTRYAPEWLRLWFSRHKKKKDNTPRLCLQVTNACIACLHVYILNIRTPTITRK